MGNTKNYRISSFIPTAFEAVIFLILGFIFLALYSYQHILAYYGVNGYTFTLPEQLIDFQAYMDLRILPVFFTALVWGFIGFLAYMGIWILMDTIFRARDANPLVTKRYVFSTERQKQYFKTTVVGQLYLRFTAIFFLIAWLIILFKIMPPLSSYLIILFTRPPLDSTLLACIGAILLAGLYLYLIAPICRLIFLRPRIFSD